MEREWIHPKTLEKLEDEVYHDGLPGYMLKVTKETIKIKVEEDNEPHTITIKDVVKYYKHDARNILSGLRSLGSIHGDWRNIDRLAEECLEIFKAINIDKLRQVSNAEGLELKF